MRVLRVRARCRARCTTAHQTSVSRESEESGSVGSSVRLVDEMVDGWGKGGSFYQIPPVVGCLTVRVLLQRLFGGRRARKPAFTCYFRENGPIAYELDLFASAPRERADAMMSSRARLGMEERHP